MGIMDKVKGKVKKEKEAVDFGKKPEETEENKEGKPIGNQMIEQIESEKPEWKKEKQEEVERYETTTLKISSIEALKDKRDFEIYYAEKYGMDSVISSKFSDKNDSGTEDSKISL